MWAVLEQELTRLLSSKVYPALRGLPAYERLLGPKGQPNPSACQNASREILNSTDLKSGIRELGSRETPKAREWVKPICRAISGRNNPNGAWWFDEELVRRWSQKYPPAIPDRKIKILESMRPMLAVCFDWNDFTDLRLMRLSSAIPVITGQGAHKPIYSPAAPEHAENANVVFIGGFTQVFVPFVNPAQTLPYHIA